METNFISQSFKATLKTLTGNMDNYLDIMGRFQELESIVQALENDYRMLDLDLTKAFYRQTQENQNLIEVLNKLNLEKMWLEYPGLQKGLLQNIPIISKRKQRLEWESIEVYPLNSDFQVITKDFNFEVIKPTQVTCSMGQDAPYCMLHLKLASYITASSFSIDKNHTDIVSIKIYIDGKWEEPISDKFLPMKESRSYMDYRFNEIKIVCKGKKIGNEYFFVANPEAFEITKKSIVQAGKVKLNPLANSIFLSATASPLYFDGYLSFNKKRYQLQIPTKEVAISRLEKTNYSAMSGYTVFRCPFPVDTTKEIQLYKSINTAESLSSWEWKVQGEEAWKSPSQLSGYTYPGIDTFSNTPRYFYIKIQGYTDSVFLMYYAKNNINSAWPLSEDGVLQYNGIGILLNNPNTADLTLTGTFYGLGVVNLQQSFPIGILGVD